MKSNIREITPEKESTLSDRVDLDQQIEALRAELAVEKAKFKLLKENVCLDALQKVLEQHECSLTALPEGQFQVLFVG